jgi:hypothetical protein
MVLRPRKHAASSHPPQPQGPSPLLSCPPEIPLLIAKYVANLPAGYSITAKTSGRKDLFNFSQSNKALREACIAAGLLSRFTPPDARRCLPAQFEELFRGLKKWPLRSLGVPLGNIGVWELCAHIMEMFPDLEGLVLSGCVENNTKRLCKSKLGSQFATFKGNSITLRRASFSGYHSEILFLLGRSNVTSFFLLESEFRLRGSKDWTLKPLFPNLKTFVFDGTSKRANSLFNPYHPTFNYKSLFSYLFLPAPPLIYFESSTGSTAKLLKHRVDDRSNGEEELNSYANSFTSRTRFGILQYLQHHVKTLEMFVDNDTLAGPFLAHTILFPFRNKKPRRDKIPRFEKMKLIVFRCESPASLTSFESGTDDCTAGSRLRLRGFGAHSVWLHV